MMFYGSDIDCSVFQIKNPSINQIIEYGQNNCIDDMVNIYETGIQLFTAHPYDYMVMLDDIKIDFEEFDKFDLFKLLYLRMITASGNEAFFDPFYRFMLGDDYKFRLYIEQDRMIVIDVEKNIEITKEIHNELHELFSMLHGLNDRKDDILFGQQVLKKLYIKKARKRLLKSNKDKKNKNSLISSRILPIIKLYNGAVTMDSIFNLNMYTITQLLEVGIRKDKYDNVMFGVYTGNVDAKSIGTETLNWASTE